MDKTLQYTQVMPNFSSAYNISPKPTPRSTLYIPMYSSTNFAPFSNRSSSPLFRRSISPPPRLPISTGAGPKFNFDLYKMDENNNEYTGYSSPSYRSISPPSSRRIHHYPIHSPTSSPTSKSGTISKLRQINDEMCHTLARSELTDELSPPPRPHYHIHHYPLSQHSYPKYRSRSTSEERPRATELEVSPKIHKARVTYKIHIPRRHRQEQQDHRYQKSSRHRSTSDEYSSNEPVTVDLYPTRDQDFVKRTRQRPDNQSPWLVDGKSLRHNSYSDAKTSRTPQGLYYGDKPIKSYRRSNRDKERPSTSTHHQSPYITYRIRPDSAPLDTSNESRAPLRTDSPPSKTRHPVWQPSSKTISQRPSKYFEPTLKPEYDGSTRNHVIDEIESEPVPRPKTLSDRTKIRNGDPKLKKRIENAESKVKSTWEPTVTGFTQLTVKESKPTVPIPVRKTTTSTPPKSKIKSIPSEPTAPTKKVVPDPPTTTNTGRSSLNDVPIKPMHESTPRSQNNTHENDDSDEDLSANESHTSEPSKKQELPHPPTPQQPRKPSAELPKTTVPEPDKGTKSTMKNGILVRGNDIRNRNPTPSPTSEVNDAQSKPNNENNEPVVDDNDRDENDDEVARSFDINKWLNDASKSILGPSKKGALVIPSTPPQPPPSSSAKPKAKSPPRRKEKPPSPPSDENLYKPPFGPKKPNPKPASPPPPPATTTTTTTGEADEVDDFFT